MATTRQIGRGFEIKNAVADTITFRQPESIDGAGGTAETHLVNRTVGTAKLMSNIVTNSNGLMTACDVPNRVADWPNAATDRFCQTQSATISFFTSGTLAEAAAVDGDILMVTPRELHHGDVMMYDSTSFNGVFNTAKNIITRAHSPLLNWSINPPANLSAGNATGVFIEDLFLHSLNAMRVTAVLKLIFRRCLFMFGSSMETFGGGDITTHSCIFEHMSNLLFGVNGSGSFHSHYHMGFMSGQTSQVINISSGHSAIIANGMFLLKDTSINPFLGAGNFTGTTNNWMGYDNTSQGAIPGTGNLTSKNVDDLKLAIFNNRDPSLFLSPYSLVTPGLGSEIDGSGITISAAHGTTEDRRDFQGNLRPTTGTQSGGPLNFQAHDGGVKAQAYSVPDNVVTFEVPISVTTDLVVT